MERDYVKELKEGKVVKIESEEQRAELYKQLGIRPRANMTLRRIIIMAVIVVLIYLLLSYINADKLFVNALGELGRDLYLKGDF